MGRCYIMIGGKWAGVAMWLVEMASRCNVIGGKWAGDTIWQVENGQVIQNSLLLQQASSARHREEMRFICIWNIANNIIFQYTAKICDLKNCRSFMHFWIEVAIRRPKILNDLYLRIVDAAFSCKKKKLRKFALKIFFFLFQKSTLWVPKIQNIILI